MASLPEPIRERIIERLGNWPGLSLAVLFGSQATGDAREGSDVDIGIVLAHGEMTLHDELALASDLSALTSTEVDIVRLDLAAPLLRAEVAREGTCLFEKTRGVFAAFRADAISEWIDFDAMIAPHRARFIRRLAGGQP